MGAASVGGAGSPAQEIGRRMPENDAPVPPAPDASPPRPRGPRRGPARAGAPPGRRAAPAAAGGPPARGVRDLLRSLRRGALRAPAARRAGARRGSRGSREPAGARTRRPPGRGMLAAALERETAPVRSRRSLDRWRSAGGCRRWARRWQPRWQAASARRRPRPAGAREEWLAARSRWRLLLALTACTSTGRRPPEPAARRPARPLPSAALSALDAAVGAAHMGGPCVLSALPCCALVARRAARSTWTPGWPAMTTRPSTPPRRGSEELRLASRQRPVLRGAVRRRHADLRGGGGAVRAGGAAPGPDDLPPRCAQAREQCAQRERRLHAVPEAEPAEATERALPVRPWLRA